MASYFIYSVQLLLVFVAFVSAVHVQNNKGDEFVHQELIRLLSLPQKSERIPKANVFKIQIGDKLMLGSFEWSSCNSSAPLVLNSLTISPDPIKLNGDVTVGFNGTANVDVVAGLNAKLVIKKKIAGFDVEIPCEDNIGSCTYGDVCGMIPPSTGCPPPFSTYKIPCKCPFKKGVYNLPPTTFAIPPVPLPGWLASGDYSISVKAYSKSGTNLACYNFKISLA